MYIVWIYIHTYIYTYIHIWLYAGQRKQWEQAVHSPVSMTQ